MLRAIVFCIWSIAVTCSSAFVTVKWLERPKVSADEEKKTKTADLKVGQVIVPIISAKGLVGYAVAAFSVKYDTKIEELEEVSLSAVARDEAYKMLYSDSDIDLSKPKKGHAKRFSELMKNNLNKRLGGNWIGEVLISELLFVPKR